MLLKITENYPGKCFYANENKKPGLNLILG